MAESKSNALEVTVSELSGKLKRTVEDTFGHVRVRGEISGYRGPHSSGHSYFSLKDDRARLEAVIWRGQAAKLKHLPEEGLEVVASGKLTTYPGSSKYQIVIDNLEPAGAGALMALLEERRRTLAAEGLFEEDRKKPLPFLPRTIGVITSPTGAVIRDILHRITDRYPVHVIVWPIRVQGETSGREAANGIHQLNRGGSSFPTPDLIVVARGGGSLEDLWGFNDEPLVRAAAASDIPIISAVGHETDWTLLDYVADWRAPTPTAAAERAVPVKADLEAHLADQAARLRGALRRLHDKKRRDLVSAARGIRSADMLLSMPHRQFDEAAGRLDRSLDVNIRECRNRLAQAAARSSPAPLTERVRAMRNRFENTARRHPASLSRVIAQKRERWSVWAERVRIASIESRLAEMQTRLTAGGGQLERLTGDRLARKKLLLERGDRLLASLSYKGTLARGFAVIRSDEGVPVSSIKALSGGKPFNVEMRDGTTGAIAREKSVDKPLPPEGKGNAKKASQGDLF